MIHVLNAALDGVGLAYVPISLAQPHIESGRLKEVLVDWSPYFEGFHLYYPNRRQASGVAGVYSVCRGGEVSRLADRFTAQPL
ncbi:hypothetical protein PSA5_26835 [Pseudomonas syringae pv. actinidiae]|nr:hypothetical protein PSA5_26835 [Pseudomonas syringae pv. actinidiae]